MSQENVEIIRRMYEAWLADDTDAVYETFDPEIKVNPDPEATWVGVDETYHGHEGLARYMESVYEAFEDYRPEVEEILDLGDDRVLTLAIEHARGRGSGAEVEARKTAHLWTLRDGKATQLDLFLDRARALQVAGLPQ
jgi:ketosteroid isomerase-like protein